MHEDSTREALYNNVRCNKIRYLLFGGTLHSEEIHEIRDGNVKE